MKRATLITILFATVAVYGCSSGDGDGTAGSGGTAGTGGSGTAGTGGSGTAGTGGSGTAGTGGSGTAGTGGSGTAGTGGSGTAGTGGSGTAGTGGSGTAGTGGSGTAGTGGSGTAGTGGSGTAGTGGSAGAGGGGGMVADVVYAQNFESLVQADTAALGDAGFQVFGNVYLPGAVTPFAFYGPFPAPNNPADPAFSLIAAGEGGTEQGAQQLVIISDYRNATEMSAGNFVEALTFQERTIEAGDVGNTWTFSFQAKLGDIGDASTAYAFVKTLTPPPTSNQTNLVQFLTTSIPATWGNYEISLDIVQGLEGQTFQFGFAATATNFEPSGVFYDNIELTSSPTP